VQIGPQNYSWSHFSTDRDKFYFNKPIYVNGTIHSYTGNNMSIGTYGKSQLTILESNGNVGIGTSAPKEKLHLFSGNFLISSGTNTNNKVDKGIHFTTDNPTYYSSISTYRGSNSASIGLRIRTMNGTTTPVEAMQISPDGNVGIGTYQPTTKLEVFDSDANLTLLKLRNSKWVCNQRTAIEFWNGGLKNYPTSRIVSQMDGCGAQGEALLFETQTAGSTNPTTKMLIKNNGNVGIGKLSPSAKLHVNGTIISKEIKVEDVTGADFVFAPEYNLVPLADIEAYIKQNHHLPEVPSAAEMQENGVELGKMNMLLLQKIEELTLLMIDMKKDNDSKIEGFTKENNHLKTEIQSMRNEIGALKIKK